MKVFSLVVGHARRSAANSLTRSKTECNATIRLEIAPQLVLQTLNPSQSGQHHSFQLVYGDRQLLEPYLKLHYVAYRCVPLPSYLQVMLALFSEEIIVSGSVSYSDG